MLQLLWNQLAYLGVASVKEADEHKHIILVNSLCLFLGPFMLLGLLSRFVVPGMPPAFPIASALYTATLVLTMVLNARGATHAARVSFAFFAWVFLTASSLMAGPGSRFHFFLLSEIMVVFFVFPSREYRSMYAVALTVFVTFIAFQFIPSAPLGMVRLDERLSRIQHLIVDTGVVALIFAFSFYIHRTFRSAERVLKAEREKSERLLLNILPGSIVARLRESSETIAERFEHCTVLFSDLVGFTGLSKSMSAVEVVSLLNEIFSAFDDLAGKHGLEKIKTIGDAYMVVGGLPEPDPLHAERVAAFALEMLDVIREYRRETDLPLELRIGINSGDAVAGVIGKRKFIYDLWGDSVNTASRMESHGLPGQIQVTETTYNLLKNRFRFTERGWIDVKGLGAIKSFFLLEGPPSNDVLSADGR